MKIYTKTGDSGITGLIGGARVPKSHIQIETYGTVDELNSYIGLINTYDINDRLKSFLLNVQRVLFEVGAILATDMNKVKKKPIFGEEHIVKLEAEIDCLEAELVELKNFIIPTGNKVVAHCHIARAICRRLERKITKLMEGTNVDICIFKYVNRLSDYLFVLARKLSKDFNIREIIV